MKMKKKYGSLLLFALAFALSFALSACGGVVRRTETVYVPGADGEPEQAAAGTVFGTVTCLGEPVAGVAVTLGAKTVLSTRAGRYSIRDAAAADGKAVFSKEGYFDCRRALKTADFTDGTARIDVELTREASISGVAVDWAGAPVQGVEVLSGGQRTLTGIDGKYVLSGVTASDGIVAFSKAGYGSVTQLVRAEWFDGSAAATGLEILMHRTAVIRGRVSDTSGLPVGGVAVACGSVSAVTDEYGYYILPGVYPERNYTLAQFNVEFKKGGTVRVYRVYLDAYLDRSDYEIDMFIENF